LTVVVVEDEHRDVELVEQPRTPEAGRGVRDQAQGVVRSTVLEAVLQELRRTGTPLPGLVVAAMAFASKRMRSPRQRPRRSTAAGIGSPLRQPFDRRRREDGAVAREGR